MTNESEALSDKRVVWRDGAEFVVEVPQHALKTRSSSLEDAFREMDASVAAMLKEYEDAGVAPPEETADVEVANGAERNSGKYSDINGWKLKVAISAIAVSVVLIVAFMGINITKNAIHNTFSNISITSMGYRIINGSAERIRSMSPDERENLEKNLGTLGEALQPLIDNATKGTEVQ